jgi:hypothetical protein
MKPLPRRRSLVHGKRVEFQSRNTPHPSAPWHTRFKLAYASIDDAQKAAGVWQEKGRILFPEDLKPAKTHESRLGGSMRRKRETGQGEMRV